MNYDFGSFDKVSFVKTGELEYELVIGDSLDVLKLKDVQLTEENTLQGQIYSSDGEKFNLSWFDDSDKKAIIDLKIGDKIEFGGKSKNTKVGWVVPVIRFVYIVAILSYNFANAECTSKVIKESNACNTSGKCVLQTNFCSIVCGQCPNREEPKPKQ